MRENHFETHSSIFDNPSIKRLIESREIDQNDFFLIEELARFPKDDIIGPLHNFFSLNGDKSLEQLDLAIGRAQEAGQESASKIYSLFRLFCERYGYDAARHLESVLEEI